MNQKLSEEQIKAIAAQLRKPEGNLGIEVGNKMNDGNKPMNLHTLTVVNPLPNQRILEIGMGNGAFVKNIVGLDATIKYTGYDYSELMVEESIGINQYWIDKGQVEFICGDANKMPFGAASFDTIFTINTFYFWDNHSRVIEELKRVLKPGGELILSVRPKHNLEKYPMTQYGFAKFSTEEIIKLLKKHNFTSIEITEIVEPEKEQFGKMITRETVILSCKL